MNTLYAALWCILAILPSPLLAPNHSPRSLIGQLTSTHRPPLNVVPLEPLREFDAEMTKWRHGAFYLPGHLPARIQCLQTLKQQLQSAGCTRKKPCIFPNELFRAKDDPTATMVISAFGHLLREVNIPHLVVGAVVERLRLGSSLVYPVLEAFLSHCVIISYANHPIYDLPMVKMAMIALHFLAGCRQKPTDDLRTCKTSSVIFPYETHNLRWSALNYLAYVSAFPWIGSFVTLSGVAFSSTVDEAKKHMGTNYWHVYRPAYEWMIRQKSEGIFAEMPFHVEKGSTLDLLPKDVLREVGSYLTIRDSHAFSTANKQASVSLVPGGPNGEERSIQAIVGGKTLVDRILNELVHLRVTGRCLHSGASEHVIKLLQQYGFSLEKPFFLGPGSTIRGARAIYECFWQGDNTYHEALKGWIMIKSEDLYPMLVDMLKDVDFQYITRVRELTQFVQPNSMSHPGHPSPPLPYVLRDEADLLAKPLDWHLEFLANELDSERSNFPKYVRAEGKVKEMMLLRLPELSVIVGRRPSYRAHFERVSSWLA